MRLVSAVLLAGLVMLVLVSPWLAARLFEGRAPARTVAIFHLLALAGLAGLPVVALGCFVVVRPGDLAAVTSPDVVKTAQSAASALAVGYLFRVAWVAVRTARATSRLATQLTLTAAAPLPASGDTAVGYVLATSQPVAYTLGGRAGGVVVSRGLLGLLDARERDAVLAHEFAHLRLRHHRLLFFAHVVCAAVGGILPAAHHARSCLARELEVIADEVAARAVDDRRVVARALAKTALATTAPTPSLAFGGERDLAYRLDRLTADRPRHERRAMAATATGLLAAGLLAIVDVTLHLRGLPAGIAFGLAGAGMCWLYWRGVVAPTRPHATSSMTSGSACR